MHRNILRYNQCHPLSVSFRSPQTPSTQSRCVLFNQTNYNLTVMITHQGSTHTGLRTMGLTNNSRRDIEWYPCSGLVRTIIFLLLSPRQFIPVDDDLSAFADRRSASIYIKYIWGMSYMSYIVCCVYIYIRVYMFSHLLDASNSAKMSFNSLKHE